RIAEATMALTADLRGRLGLERGRLHDRRVATADQVCAVTAQWISMDGNVSIGGTVACFTGNAEFGDARIGGAAVGKINLGLAVCDMAVDTHGVPQAGRGRGPTDRRSEEHHRTRYPSSFGDDVGSRYLANDAAPVRAIPI